MSLKFPVKFSSSLALLWTHALKTGVPFVLRKTDVFPLKPGAAKWNKERPKTAIRRYGL